MSPQPWLDETPIQARIPADLDTPDQIIAGLSVHQGAVLAGVAGLEWLTWKLLNPHVPTTALTLVLAVMAAAAVAVVLGRRDGLGLDAWLWAAFRYANSPRRLAPATLDEGRGPGEDVFPSWAAAIRSTSTRVRPATRRGGAPARLRLPADSIGADGVIATGPGSAVVLVSATTLSIGLQTPADQGAVLAGYSRWLNGLSGPVQLVIANRPVDLGSRALRLAENSHRLPDPALAEAAIDQAEFLLDLAEDLPLARAVILACSSRTTGTTSTTSAVRTGMTAAGAAPPLARPAFFRNRTRQPGRDSAAARVAGIEAVRRALRTMEALTALGSRCQVLDGAGATAALAVACDPLAPAGAGWTRLPPESPLTSRYVRPRVAPGTADHRGAGPRPGPHARESAASARSARILANPVPNPWGNHGDGAVGTSPDHMTDPMTEAIDAAWGEDTDRRFS